MWPSSKIGYGNIECEKNCDVEKSNIKYNIKNMPTDKYKNNLAVKPASFFDVPVVLFGVVFHVSCFYLV